MKILYLFTCFVCLSLNIYSQVFNWVGTSLFGGQNTVRSTNCDSSGNVYYSGTYTNPCQHCSPPPPGGWLAKYTSSNSLMWQDTVNNVRWLKGVANKNGDYFITGNFWAASVKFGQFILQCNDTTWNYNYGRNGFIAKYNSTGVCQWAKIIPYAYCDDIVINGSNIYITGYGNYANNVTFFDSIPLENNKHLFVVEYSNSGQATWVQGFAHSSPFDKTLIQVNDSNIYLSGKQLGNSRGFITKLKINGDSIWSRTVPTPPSGITVNNKNELYSVGYFWRKDTIDNVIYGNATSYYSGYIIRFDVNGNINFVRANTPVGNIPQFYFDGIDFNNGSLYVTASLSSGTIIFDGDTISAAYGESKLIIFKMNEFGSLIWEKHSETNLQFGATCWGKVVYKSKIDNFLYVSGATHGPILLDSLFIDAPPYNSFLRLQLSDHTLTAINEHGHSLNSSVIYPNPTSGIFLVQMSNQNSKTKIIVHDVLGNCLFEKNCYEETNPQIDLSSYGKGIYFVGVVSGDERAIKKVIVQ